MASLIRQQIRLMSRGSKSMNDSYLIVNEYIVRKKLYAIGFTASDLKELDAEKAAHFLSVDNAIELEKQDAEKRAMKKRR